VIRDPCFSNSARSLAASLGALQVIVVVVCGTVGGVVVQTLPPVLNAGGAAGGCGAM
jgi:hypothetical protein